MILAKRSEGVATQTGVETWPRTTLTPLQAARLRKLARAWRKKNRWRGEFQGGYVVVWSGMADGWTSTLDDPSKCRPGVYAVPAIEDAPIHVATGGNYQRGATAWTEVAP